MKVSYDELADAAYIELVPDGRHATTTRVDETIALDFDAQGRLIGIEVLAASNRLDVPSLEQLEFAQYTTADSEVMSNVTVGRRRQ